MDLQGTFIGETVLNERERALKAREAAKIALQEAERQRIVQEAAKAENARRQEPFNLVKILVGNAKRGAHGALLTRGPSETVVQYPLNADQDGMPQKLVIVACTQQEGRLIKNATLKLKLGNTEDDETVHDLAKITDPSSGLDGMVSPTYGIVAKISDPQAKLIPEMASVIREAATLAGIPVLLEANTAATQ